MSSLGRIDSVKKFDGEIAVINPFTENTSLLTYDSWFTACRNAELAYLELISRKNVTPQIARSVLPNCLKTELVMTANLREWRHFFKLRCAPAAHPQMREVAMMLLEKMKAAIPVVFDDLEVSK
ncbi:MAG: FAD-dependent thymidylate synthase [Selenomonadaceae bacterium]|nr:FAD-dependent thymidylate synthase [Selenomonadaceae bacterium]